MSTHKCPVVKIQKKPHPNADALSIQEINGYEVCLRTEDWEDGQLAVYCPPDYVVPDTELFTWLKTDHKNWNRIRTKRFRGRYSHGLMVPAPPGLSEGDDAMGFLGITRYIPPALESEGGDDEMAPDGGDRTYDIENFQGSKAHFTDGEEVIVTEKIHGRNTRFLWQDDRMWVGSRVCWKVKNPKNVFWQALEQNSWIEEWCKANPGLIVFGETFGQISSLKYGSKQGEIFFRAFDILRKDVWLDYDEARSLAGDSLKWVPELYRGPYNEEMLTELALNDSSFPGAKHKQEGIVIRPVKERYDAEFGRAVLKLVSPRYLESAKD